MNCIDISKSVRVKNACFIARNHFGQLASHDDSLSRCALNLSWAITGNF